VYGKASLKSGIRREYPAVASRVFFNEPLLIVDDHLQSLSGQRYHALGRTDLGRPLHIPFTLRYQDTLIRVISARSMHRRERRIYEQAKKENPDV
jgi:hypothetical protein